METDTSSSCGGSAGAEQRGIGLVEVQAAAAALRRSEVFHVVKELVGFVLYMHHQIPSVLSSLENEFASLKEEMTEMTLRPAELKPSDQRRYNTRKREVRRRIKKHEKLMNGISTLLCSLQQALDEVSSIEGVVLILGGSLVRPLFVYDITISHGIFDPGSAKEHALTKLAQSVSRKAIRALVSCGAGSLSYTGPSKLFLLVRCPSTLNLPQDFLPRRDFRYSKKVVPLQMHIKCSKSVCSGNNQHHMPVVDAPCSASESSLSDVIWFQCKHTIRGLPGKASLEG
ncbi:hypothetical protein BDA96_03G161000 [Sorghum bicolor]|uniref:Uncharacterized protein n=2 Tax=Sorghum bicolor TaxID=4558 RepID=A0A921RBZ3_SORBI|nr:uncharacterized protein LOC8075297 [Sorghum bicolor]KAG0537584.1 hypothetical protein BDA96_03G161000 [Sorghum bicolor]KXG32424.2 hypothetical protein SORBI_3003G152500 [Sorghum bicolor]|eukprot:XP_002455569.1 uncharacterized protein LOC8075297 [Sorghum bicolor]